MKWEEIESKLEQGKDIVYKKGKTYMDILALKGQVSTCKDVIEKDYIAIGKMYVEKFGEENPYPEFDKKIREINNATRAIIDLETQIEQLKSET